MDEIKSLPENVQAQFRRHVRIQDDPDLWWTGDVAISYFTL
jgi:hypothetical protein